jgi:hypothetical protein
MVIVIYSCYITLLHSRSKVYDRQKETIKRIGSDREDILKKDKDLQLLLSKGKQLISCIYSDS